MLANGQAAPAVIATNAHCGQTITASLTLNGDLVCTASLGLNVSGTSVVLNLNGHEISGAGGGNGVQIFGKSDTVENGLITDFFYGVFVFGATDTISAVRATYNGDAGIVDDGTGTKITNCVATNNVFTGIASSSTGSVLTGDHELNNGSTVSQPGLIVDGTKQTVTGNVANGNGGDGIDDFGFGTTLTKNVANFNHLDGILVNEVAAIDGAGNTAKGNGYAAGATPDQCNGVVCS